MKLNYDKKSKDPTYFIQMGIRNGKKTTTKNVARIGKHSELLKITSDPLAYALEQVRKYNEDYQKEKKVTMDFRVDFAEKIKAADEAAARSTRLNIGYLFLQQFYQQLGIRSFFQKVCADSKITFDPNEVNRFLTFARILEPDSKLGTYDHLDRYYEQPSFDYVHILRTMDILSAHYDEYISHLYENSKKIVKWNTSVCYYDCTNYYFEAEAPDEEYVDEVTGEVLKGLRQYGVSKEHRPNPIVEMGLFMDGDGIPLSMCITSGSDNEQTTAIPLEEKMTKMFQGKPFIYCADAGPGSLKIRNFNSMGSRAFIVTQSVKKLSDVLQKAVFNDCGYCLLSNDKKISIEDMKSFDRFDPANLKLYNDRAYKIIEANHAYETGLYETKTLKNGKTVEVKSMATLKQKVIITFSRKMMEYQRSVRERQIARARRILAAMDPDEYRKGPNDVTRFIKKVSGSEKNTYELNQERIQEEEKYDGYYAVATNLEDKASAILEISAGRNKIEDCFRILKTNFSARPVYHQKRERIIAHFLICYTALLIYRLLEKKLDMNGTHFTTDQIIETLKNMEVVNIDDLCYMSIYTCSTAVTALNAISCLKLDRKYYQPKELNQKIRGLKRITKSEQSEKADAV